MIALHCCEDLAAVTLSVLPLETEECDPVRHRSSNCSLHRGPRALRLKDRLEVPPRGRVAVSERVAVVLRVSKVRLVDVFDSLAREATRQSVLREAGLSADRSEPNVDHDRNSCSVQRRNELVYGATFVPHADQRPNESRLGLHDPSHSGPRELGVLGKLSQGGAARV